jgi:hypothetical protein
MEDEAKKLNRITAVEECDARNDHPCSYRWLKKIKTYK